ncbi:MAG: RnfABCDGE type electron transport complex subunit D [Huintestinicola sp.]|uniref:RnfABCDGE type electron transport complex subunit D n=1 Tax=Huintestinicola sp. TaxID=2981661 RepID=UPI003F0E274A
MKKKEPRMLTTFVREQREKTGRPEDFGAMINMLLVLLVTAAMSVYYYGMRAAVLCLLCVGVCWGLDVLCLIIQRKSLHIHDVSPIITGLTIALMLPASVPYTIAAAACAFAICIAKHPLGGHGREIFNCAAAGYIFAELCFPAAVLSYPKPMTSLPLTNVITEGLYPSFTSAAMRSTSASYTDIELLIGNFTGPMGCTFTVLTAVCALYLISRKAISGTVFFTELAIVLGWSLAAGGVFRVKTALVGGMLLFGSSVLSCDNGIVPKTFPEKILFGVISAAILIAAGEISRLENPVVYAAVLAAPFGRLTGKFGEFARRRKRAKSIFGKYADDINETIAMTGGGDDGSG